MEKVIIESPFAGDTERNILYLKECMKDCFKRGEAPFASHLLYTQILDDLIPNERTLGIEAGLEWGKVSDKVVVYQDYGLSHGMKLGIDRAIKEKRKIEYRRIY